MDIVSFIIGACGGSATLFAGLYAYARMQGFKLLPDDLGETVAALEADYSELLEEIDGAVGNISLTEIGKIFVCAQELGKDGYNMADAQKLGIMIIDAAKD